MPKRTNDGMRAEAPATESAANRLIRKIDRGPSYGPDYEQHGGRSNHGVKG